MPFCHECGASVAATDTFCNDCGIVLKPMVVAEQKPAEVKPQVVARPASEPLGLAGSGPVPNLGPVAGFAPPVGPKAPAQVAVPGPVVTAAPPVPVAAMKGSDAKAPSARADADVAGGPAIGAALPAGRASSPFDLTIGGNVSLEEVAEPATLPKASENKAQARVADQAEAARREVPLPVPPAVVNDVAAPKPGPAGTDPSTSVAPPAPLTREPVREPVRESVKPGLKTPDAAVKKPFDDKLAEVGAASIVPALPAAASTAEKKSSAPASKSAKSFERRGHAGQLKEGTVLHGRYEIVRRIGGGGMGAVYLAKDKHLGDTPRAVKEMIQTHIDEVQQQKAIGDFKRESLILTSLEHPAIPTIYDYFYDEGAGRFYLVMKYISGGDLATRMKNASGGRLDEATVATWSIEVADVLSYLHCHNPPIIYRDLKPANLMIDGNSGRVMLIDFGIARTVNKDEKGVTAVGTMGYAPPELFGGKVEQRSDIYSLGATIFHMLTGADPQDAPLLIFDFTKNPRPRAINPAISIEMEQILMRTVEYKPEDRFRSAAELRDVLAAHMERMQAGTLTYGAVANADLSSTAPSIQLVFCGFCGLGIGAEDLYCAHCGKGQPLASLTPSAGLAAARVTARLVLAGTTELETPAFSLEKEINLVGRTDPQTNNFPEVDLTRFDPQTKVSRRHARIWRKGEMFLVEDLGSSNGTVLFGRGNDTIRLAPHQPRVLENGDRLRMGETMLRFVMG